MRSDRRQKDAVRNPRSNASVDQSFAFRRSRTITGSSSTNVRAASEDRGQLQSSRLHEHSLRKHRRKLILYLLTSLVLCGALWYVVTSYLGSTVSVGTSTTQALATPLQEDRYKSLVAQYFTEYPLERFTFTLNDKQFNTFITAKAAEVASSSLHKGSRLGSSELTLQLREPVVAWTINNNPYFVDAEGVAFTVNQFAIPRVVVTDKSGISAQAGVVASQKLLRFIGRVITLVNASSHKVETVELPASSTREVNFKLAGKSYIIKAHLDRDPAGQAADIINAVTYVTEKNINPEYLDVRVSSKAFYRPR